MVEVATVEEIAGWTDDPGCCRAAGVPAQVGFVTKPHQGLAMLKRALADPAVVFSWFAADSGYGRDPALRRFCHDQQVPYVLAVPVDLPLLDVRGQPLRPDAVLACTPATVWQRRSCGDGSTGKRSTTGPRMPWWSRTSRRPMGTSTPC
ncbi:transposase [Dactylosporangium sp. NPDC006015]|uniref:transposase n=1 Tax=Dactylosporangium sp. NPDC006015 TaxID=3154576 RepID=UPI0033BD2615